MFKVFVLSAILGCTMAAPHATSYASVKQYHGHDHGHHGHYDYDHDDYPNYASSYAGYGAEYGSGYGGGYGAGYGGYGSGYYGSALGHGYDGQYNGYYDGHDDGHNDNYDDHHEYYHHPQYAYKYGVHDPHTHDIKSQEEHRDGDVVKGHYKLVQPDGRTRVVHYTADGHNGFNADVQYLGHAEHPSYYKYY